VLERDDCAIEREVRTLIRDLFLFDDAGLRVDAGVVGLRGRTPMKNEAEAVQRMISGLPGVVGLRGQIECTG
jgi:hypothetical protein